jgi:hypothetical protein
MLLKVTGSRSQTFQHRENALPQPLLMELQHLAKTFPDGARFGMYSATS